MCLEIECINYISKVLEYFLIRLLAIPSDWAALILGSTLFQSLAVSIVKLSLAALYFSCSFHSICVLALTSLSPVLSQVKVNIQYVLL